MIWAFLLTPLWRWAIAGVVVAAVLGGVLIKIQHDAVAVERARVEQEKADAVKKANEARERLRDACDRDASACVPEDNYRD
jgi:hypothetical protein